MNPAANGSYKERLLACYAQLSEAVQSESVTAEQIIMLSDTADKIIAELKKDSAYRATLKPEEILEMKLKADALIRLLKDEMQKLSSQISKVQTGRRAVKGYQPLQVGMGFTEGKFMDIKK